MKVYILNGMSECYDNYYPEYHFIIGVYETREKAEQAGKKFDDDNQDSDPCDYIPGSWYVLEFLVK